MSDTPPAAAPAQLSYTTNVFASPEFIGAAGTIIALLAGQFGVQLPHLDPATQQMLVAFLGMAATGFFHWLFPGASGNLGLMAPSPASVPVSQPVQVGASVVHVAAPADQVQVTSVQPIDVGTHTVEVAPPAQVGQTTPASVVITPVP